MCLEFGVDPIQSDIGSFFPRKHHLPQSARTFLSFYKQNRDLGCSREMGQSHPLAILGAVGISGVSYSGALAKRLDRVFFREHFSDMKDMTLGVSSPGLAV